MRISWLPIRESWKPACIFALCSLVLPGMLQVAAGQPSIPPLSGRVVDMAGILSSDTVNEATAMLRMHEDSTSNQVAVLTITSLEGAVLEDYSLDVARTWALGQAGRDNGVLLLVAYNDRKMRIEVGYGLEGDMPDVVAKRIIDNEIRPYFRDQDFDGGVLNGVRAIVGTLEGTYAPLEHTGNEEPLILKLLFGLMFMFIPAVSLWSVMFQAYASRWIMLGFMMPMFWIAGATIFPPYGGIVIPVVVLLLFGGFQWYISVSPKWKDYQKAMKKARQMKKAVPVKIGGREVLVGPRSASQRRSSGGSSGGSSFRGGGGSFGGGGASGGW